MGTLCFIYVYTCIANNQILPWPTIYVCIVMFFPNFVLLRHSCMNVLQVGSLPFIKNYMSIEIPILYHDTIIEKKITFTLLLLSVQKSVKQT